jgi:hypothetical protein
MIWREKRVLLIVLGVVLLANTLFFFTRRVQYEKRLHDLDARLQQTDTALQQAHRARLLAEQQMANYDKVQRDLQILYNNAWATQAQRLTALITEVQRLEVASQLVPRMSSFGKTESREMTRSGGIGTSTVNITFTVQGSYHQIRRLINLLELSNQFVIIDAINLAGTSDANNLSLSLRLKTLFRQPSRGNMINKEM